MNPQDSYEPLGKSLQVRKQPYVDFYYDNNWVPRRDIALNPKPLTRHFAP